MAKFPKPIFGLNDLLRMGTLVLDESLAGFPFTNAQDGRTDSQAGFTGDGSDYYATIDLGVAIAFDFVAFGRHNFGSVGATITIETSPDNATWTPVGSITPTTDKPLMDLNISGNDRYIRLTFNAATEDMYFADVTISEQFEWATELPAAFIIPRWSDNDQLNVNRTRGGQLAGFSVITKPKTTSINLRWQDLSYFDSEWDDFVSAIKQYPFYFMWNPDRPTEVMFCWLPTGNSIPTPRFLQENILQTSFSVEGFA